MLFIEFTLLVLGVVRLEDKFERLFELFDEKAPVKHTVFQAAKIAEETGEAISLALNSLVKPRVKTDL
jgi:hypothetical protein